MGESASAHLAFCVFGWSLLTARTSARFKKAKALRGLASQTARGSGRRPRHQFTGCGKKAKSFLQGLKPVDSAQVTSELKLRPPKERTYSACCSVGVTVRSATSSGPGTQSGRFRRESSPPPSTANSSQGTHHEKPKTGSIKVRRIVCGTPSASGQLAHLREQLSMDGQVISPRHKKLTQAVFGKPLESVFHYSGDE